MTVQQRDPLRRFKARSIDGRPPATLKQGESLEVPAGAVHDERAGDQPAKLLAVFTVEKGKPLTSPVQAAK